MNALARILGTIDGNIDLGAITGIFGRIVALVQRVPDLIARARALAEKFKNDPELRKFFDDVQDLIGDIPGLLRLDSGEEITDAEIAAMRQHWGAGGDEPVYDRPKKTPPPPLPTGILNSDPGMQAFPKDVYVTTSVPLKYIIHSGRVGDPVPTEFTPSIPGVEEPPGWHILHDSQR